MDKVEIPLSKTKIGLLLLAALVFVVGGILFVMTPDKYVSHVMRSLLIIRIVGFASVLFFGLGSIYGIVKLFDNRIGLTIDENGIFDNSNASSIGLIKWTDIIKIRVEQVSSTKFFLIYTSNPYYYLDKAKGFKRKLLEMNNKRYGTPLSITTATLKYKFNDLEILLKDCHHKFRGQ